MQPLGRSAATAAPQRARAAAMRWRTRQHGRAAAPPLLQPASSPRRPARRARASSTDSAQYSSSGSSGGSSSPPPAQQQVPFEEAAAAVLAGRSFKCTMCGKCCTMEDDGEVWVSRREVQSMARHLGLTAAQFVSRYCLERDSDGLAIPGWWLLQSQRAPDGKLHCTFLDVATNMCRVHEARPVQCSTYPWWPELLAQRGVWEWEKANICEGLDHPDAEPLDQAAATEQLRRAAAHELAKRRAKAGGGAAGGAAGG